MADLKSLLTVMLPTRRPNPKGVAVTQTYNPSGKDNVLAAPSYRDHLQDIFNTRQAQDTRSLIKDLSKHDSDFSAAFNAYLTMANTRFSYLVRDVDGQIDREGQKIVDQMILGITHRQDYTKGFLLKPQLNNLFQEMRRMVLLRGGLGVELILSKEFLPTGYRHVDLASIEWKELEPGMYQPIQSGKGGAKIDLNIPTFFASFYHRDPTDIYSDSPFVSAVNIVAARQQVINDLYRIMRLTGYPRISVTVLEEVLIKNAPANVRQNPKEQQAYVSAQLQSIGTSFGSLRPDQPFIHTDSIEVAVMNEKAPAMALDVSSIISVLNSANQAALKTMATIIGRGESGVNTASVEARVFSMNTDEVNDPLKEAMSHSLTLGLRLHGNESFVETKFEPAEMRSPMELEPQKTMHAARLKEDLSLGLITDEEYHLQVHGRLPPDGAPMLSGTGFMNQGKVSVDETKVSPNADPLGRSLTPPGSKSAKSNTTKKVSK